MRNPHPLHWFSGLELRFAPLALVGLLLAGCLNIDIGERDFVPDPAIQARIIDQQEDRFPDVDTLALSDEIRAYLHQHVDFAARGDEKVERLQTLLFSPDHLNLQYSEERTQTAVEVFHSRMGNCLSVMNLYVAMARYVGLDAAFQTVRVRPTWDLRGGLLVLNQHINATGRVSPRATYVVDFTPEIALQQLTSRTVSDDLARALYFTNLGVEALIADDVPQALIYLRNALWIDPTLSIAWNNIGTALNRSGAPELAEYSFQMAFELDGENATAIGNLARYYAAQGDEATAARYRLAIERFNRQNPYYHFEQGNHFFAEGDYSKAAAAYEEAVDLKEVEPDFYFALAITYARMGDERQAIQMAARGNALLTTNDAIYRPSDQKVRFIDSETIIRGASPSMTIYPNGRSRR